jgi:hypothetical protein
MWDDFLIWGFPGVVVSPWQPGASHPINSQPLASHGICGSHIETYGFLNMEPEKL